MRLDRASRLRVAFVRCRVSRSMAGANRPTATTKPPPLALLTWPGLGSSSRATRSWRTDEPWVPSTSGCPLGRRLSGGRPGPACRTACRGQPSFRSTPASRRPVRTPGRTHRSCSCGGRGSAPTSSLRGPRGLLARAAARRCGPATRCRGSRQPAPCLPRRPEDALRRGGSRARRAPQQPQVRRADRHGLDPVGWGSPAQRSGPCRRRTSNARDARLELARRYLHIFGPATPVGFAQWAGIRPAAAGHAAFDALAGSLTPVRTPVGDAWILTRTSQRFAHRDDPSRRRGFSRAGMRTPS